MSDQFHPNIDDLVSTAEADVADLSTLPILVPGLAQATILSADGEIETLPIADAGRRASAQPHLVLNRTLAARRLQMQWLKAYDLLELYAFCRPSRFCLPTVKGLADALVLDIGAIDDAADEALALRALAAHLLADLAADTYRYADGAHRVAMVMARGGWTWGPLVLAALHNSTADRRRDGLAVWTLLDEWEDLAPPPPPGDASVTASQSAKRLSQLLGDSSEERTGQQRYSEAATYSFASPQFEDGPNIQLLEAGTGTGKTLGYLAPASVWSDVNKGPVWLATYTKALQRQLDQELSKLYPDPQEKRAKTVIRKGRENYLCLLNLDDMARASFSSLVGGDNPDAVLLGLVLRWARYSRDGDMVGGDFPSWLGAHFGAGRVAGLTDRRGECLYSACAHYKKCFVEKAARKSKHVNIVVANHALVIAQAVNRMGDPDLPKRLVFDEGHHLFDSADSAFATILSGQEGAELRRWLRGKEQGGRTRARGLKVRLEDHLDNNDDDLKTALDGVLEAARQLPGEGWLARLSASNPMSKFEDFLVNLRTHVLKLTDEATFESAQAFGLEAPLDSPDDALISSARALIPELHRLQKPLRHLAKGLVNLLADEAAELDSADKGRLESVARSLVLRAEQVAAWVAMLQRFYDGPDATFVDWAALQRAHGRERDVAYCRHYIDPSKPLAKGVLSNLHGCLITSATLRDHASDAENWQGADRQTGAQHLPVAPRRLSVASPYEYAKATRVLVVTDVDRNDPAQVAAAYRALFLASGGGGLGLFTAIHRLRAVHQHLSPAFDDLGLPLYAQHVDPIEVGTLVDMFRAERDACLLGTDAVRDGVDVPGDSLRMIIFDRVPWPRPSLLHKARRDHFGGRYYDDMITRLKLKQAFGRLIRRSSDRGVFVLLDNRTPSRLLSALPEGVQIDRLSLKQAVIAARDFLSSDANP